MGRSVDVLFAYLRDLFYDSERAVLDLDQLDEEHRQLGEGLVFLAQNYTEARRFAKSLGKGVLNAPAPPPENELAAPLKELQAALKHLTWQTQQVAQGDYQQRLDFMGDFSQAFNTMVIQLEQRQRDLQNEIEVSHNKTKALEQSYSLLMDLANRRSEWMVIISVADRQVLFMNTTAEKVLQRDEKGTTPMWEWMDEFLNRHPEGFDASTYEFTFQWAGEPQTFIIGVYPVGWNNTNAAAFVCENISIAKAEQVKLENYAYKDNLTQLNNRMFGLQLLRSWIDSKERFCLCFVDLDNLKYVNDTYGHSQGDKYLILAADILREFSDEAVVARLGGDEFLLLEPGEDKWKVERRLEELRDLMQSRLSDEKTRFVSSLSYGVIAVGRDNKYTASELLAMADEQMYNYKREHKSERFRRTNTLSMLGEEKESS